MGSVVKLDPSMQVSSVPERFSYALAPGFLRGSMQARGWASTNVVQVVIDEGTEQTAIAQKCTKLSNHNVSVVGHFKSTTVTKAAVYGVKHLASVKSEDATLELASQESLPINSDGVIDE
jgi:hypothetical protein